MTKIAGDKRIGARAAFTLLVTVLLSLLPASAALAHALFSLDASMGYIFVSEAAETPWLSNTILPSAAVGVGGDAWSIGVSVDYARNIAKFQGSVPGYSDSLESVEKDLSNPSVKLFARIFPAGREKVVSPYLGLGVGPALTSVEYRGANTGRKNSDSAVRVSYLVSVGSKVRFGNSPLSVFLEGSFGGLGAIASKSEKTRVPIPETGFDFVGVAVGLGLTFH